MTDALNTLAIFLLLLYLSFPQAFRPFVKIIVVILRPVSTVMRLLPRSLRYIYVFIVLSVVLSISLLTYIVQLVAKIRTPGITRNAIELLIGENNICEVRRDLLQVLPFEESSTSNKNRDLGTIREDAKERMQTAELTFSVAIAVAFLIHEYSGQVIITIESPVERLIQIYVPTLTLATVFRTTLVDVLAYSSEDEPDGIIHEKAVAWQLAITRVGRVSALSAVVAAFRRTNQSAYNRAIDLLQFRYDEDAGFVQLIREAI